MRFAIKLEKEPQQGEAHRCSPRHHGAPLLSSCLADGVGAELGGRAVLGLGGDGPFPCSTQGVPPPHLGTTLAVTSRFCLHTGGRRWLPCQVTQQASGQQPFPAHLSLGSQGLRRMILGLQGAGPMVRAALASELGTSRRGGWAYPAAGPVSEAAAHGVLRPGHRQPLGELLRPWPGGV